MRRVINFVLPALAAFALVPAAQAQAQDAGMRPIAAPAQPGAIALDTGPLPGATAFESWHSQYGSAFARNVTQATLTPFLPDPAKATGAAVIVAPGGGFRMLSMENEGWDVARALADRGIAAFVLKYRLIQTRPDLPDFQREMAELRKSLSGPVAERPRDPFGDLGPQRADTRAAFALIRARAAEWKIDPRRVGMVGFSSGAGLTMATTLGGETRPAFIGLIYGAIDSTQVPDDAPPLFAALAADDPLFAGKRLGLIEAWMAARKPVEFHLYGRGGHGFGMYQRDTTSTGWFDAFVAWMKMMGFTERREE